MNKILKKILTTIGIVAICTIVFLITYIVYFTMTFELTIGNDIANTVNDVMTAFNGFN